MIELSHYSFELKFIELKPYKIKLNQALKTAKQEVYYRQGFVLQGELMNGLRVSGECAPMECQGTESLRQAEEILRKKLALLVNTASAIIFTSEALKGMEHTPASRFCIETLLLDCVSKFSNKKLYQLLSLDKKTKTKTKIKVNAMLGSLDQHSLEKLKIIQASGYFCVKFKLGLAQIEQEWDSLLGLLEALRLKNCAEFKLRLDINKAWTVEQTRWFLQQLKAYEQYIDCIEEPLCRFNLTDYKKLQKSTNIALALDESFSRDFLHSYSMADYPLKRLVLKPMVQGGILKTWRLAKLAQKYNIESVVTSCIETGHGLIPIMHLAAAMVSEVNNQQYHGLATAAWLESTLLTTPEIINGSITL